MKYFNSIFNKFNIIKNYITLYSKMAEYTFFLGTSGATTKFDYMKDIHKASHNKL